MSASKLKEELSVAEAARILQVNTQRIRQFIQAGRLNATMRNPANGDRGRPRWFINRLDLLPLKRRTNGRPRKSNPTARRTQLTRL